MPRAGQGRHPGPYQPQRCRCQGKRCWHQSADAVPAGLHRCCPRRAEVLRRHQHHRGADCHGRLCGRGGASGSISTRVLHGRVAGEARDRSNRKHQEGQRDGGLEQGLVLARGGAGGRRRGLGWEVISHLEERHSVGPHRHADGFLERVGPAWRELQQGAVGATAANSPQRRAVALRRARRRPHHCAQPLAPLRRSGEERPGLSPRRGLRAVPGGPSQARGDCRGQVDLWCLCQHRLGGQVACPRCAAHPLGGDLDECLHLRHCSAGRGSLLPRLLGRGCLRRLQPRLAPEGRELDPRATVEEGPP
mmetsp:Transcript_135312/g.337611  ORF Transcript_135312/g.337611 Transcript_135312/m.337611 type:complete len:306 (+) Transcript_135312:371-1288(+)